MTGEKVVCGLAVQFSDCTTNVSRHHSRSGFRRRDSAEKVTGERRSKRRIVAGKPRFIGQDAAVKGPSHALHVLSDTEITDPNLAQRAVEIGEHSVEKALGEPARLGPIGLETMKIQKRMEANQFKAPVERVRYAILGEENRLSSLF
jgi:hypothetical protein